MTFQEAQHKLLAFVRDRIYNGELTERGFARLIGISQPHAHNVLKGARNISPDIFDSTLRCFHLSILDLAPDEQIADNLKKRKAEPITTVGFLDGRIGPGLPWPERVDWQKRFPLPFPAITAPDLVMVQLAADPPMYLTLAHSDIALLDTSERQRAIISPEGLYAVNRGGEAVLRYVRPGARRYYLVTDTAMDDPALWERISVSAARLSDFIKARVRWLGREQDRNLPAAQRGRFLYDAISS